MLFTSSTPLLLLSLNTAILLSFFLEAIWLPCWVSPLLEHVLFFKYMRNWFSPLITVKNTFPLVISVGNKFPLVITVENTFLPLITVGNRFPLAITVENTFLPLINVGNRFPPLITVGNTFSLLENTFPLVITVKNTFPSLITVRNRFPLLVTVGKNNGSSFFQKKKRGTSEMSSMAHRTILPYYHFSSWETWKH